MSSETDGGQAFPAADHFGITLRDYFAGQWIIGMGVNPGLDTTFRKIAQECYVMADAMIAARNGKEGA